MQQLPNNNFDQFIKGKLENASVEPPAFLWNKIEQKLPPVTPWYSKYKYLILLLGLGFTSATSISIYKHFYLSNIESNSNTLKNRLYKDENKAYKNTKANINNTASLNVGADNNKNTQENNTIVNNLDNNNKPNNNTTVASFYNNTSSNNVASKNNTTAINETAKTTVKREARLKRLEVKQNTSDILANTKTTTNTLSDATALNTASVSATNKITSINKLIHKKTNSTTADKSTIANSEDAVAINIKNTTDDIIDYDNIKYDNINSTFASSVNTDNKSATDDDVTIPIAEPINSSNANELTASAVPVKENITPLSSREALRALIEKDKLENLEISSQAAGVTDLNPNKEKILKNLKQFAGYSINRGFHIGAFIGINNVWLSKKQFSADENTSSIKPKVQFGKAYGINIGYDYTDRLGIELEWQMSEQGQKYNIGLLSDNNKHTKDINLLYSKFPILFKYRQTFLNNYNSKPISVSFLVGPQFSFLVKQDVKVDGVKINNAPQYNKMEFGLNGGFDFDLYMMRYMYLTIGTRTGFGSSFKKNQPMSFQLGVSMQLNFRYAKKLK